MPDVRVPGEFPAMTDRQLWHIETVAPDGQTHPLTSVGPFSSAAAAHEFCRQWNYHLTRPIFRVVTTDDLADA